MDAGSFPQSAGSFSQSMDGAESFSQRSSEHLKPSNQPDDEFFDWKTHGFEWPTASTDSMDPVEPAGLSATQHVSPEPSSGTPSPAPYIPQAGHVLQRAGATLNLVAGAKAEESKPSTVVEAKPEKSKPSTAEKWASRFFSPLAVVGFLGAGLLKLTVSAGTLPLLLLPGGGRARMIAKIPFNMVMYGSAKILETADWLKDDKAAAPPAKAAPPPAPGNSPPRTRPTLSSEQQTAKDITRLTKKIAGYETRLNILRAERPQTGQRQTEINTEIALKSADLEQCQTKLNELTGK